MANSSFKGIIWKSIKLWVVTLKDENLSSDALRLEKEMSASELIPEGLMKL
jgi:hypothetical protein